MSGRLQAIARETVAMLESGSVPGVADAVAGTRLHLPDDAITSSGAINPAPLIAGGWAWA